MKHKGNKLTPSDGMCLKRKSDGSVYESSIYIPDSLKDDFEEITTEEYKKLTQQADTDTTDDITERVSKLESQISNNTAELTSLQNIISTIQEMLTRLDDFKIKGE